ncbi:hypothetical protein GW17_00046655 [Ensete ventricosum]|nr:hypothetical protein GW17_00046655 [Ensete ventricosum]
MRLPTSTWDVTQVTAEGVLPVYVGGAVVDGSLLSSTAWLRRDRYVINYGEGLTTVDFDGHVSLAEKKGTCMAERRSGTGHAQ